MENIHPAIQKLATKPEELLVLKGDKLHPEQTRPANKKEIEEYKTLLHDIQNCIFISLTDKKKELNGTKEFGYMLDSTFATTANYGQLVLLEALVKAGAKPEMKPGSRLQTVYKIETAISDPRNTNKIKTLKYFLRHGLDIDAGNKEISVSAIKTGNADVLELALNIGSKIDKDKALQIAASEGQNNIVKTLLTVGLATASKNNALRAAAINGHTECMRTLVGAGADPTCNCNHIYWGPAGIEKSELPEAKLLEVMQTAIELGADPHGMADLAVANALKTNNLKCLEHALQNGCKATASYNAQGKNTRMYCLAQKKAWPILVKYIEPYDTAMAKDIAQHISKANPTLAATWLSTWMIQQQAKKTAQKI